MTMDLKSTVTSIAVAGLAVFLAGCTDYEADPPADPLDEAPQTIPGEPGVGVGVEVPQPATSDNTEEVADDIRAERDRFTEEMEDKLEKLDEQIQDISEDLREAGEEASESMDDTLAELRAQRSEINEQWADLKAASKDTWEDTKQRFDNAVDTLDREIAELLADLRDEP